MESTSVPDDLRDVVARSLRQSQLVCEVILASYRVELTRTLSRMAHTSRGFAPDDIAQLRDVAGRIAGAAELAKLLGVRNEALDLQVRTTAPRRTRKDEREMLAAGMRVIDGILASGPTIALRRRGPASAALN